MTEIEEEIAESLLEYVGCDNINTDIEIGNTTVNVRGYIRTFGYTEDDYHCGYENGTGALITTSADVCLSFNVTTYDDDGNETEDVVEIDEDAVVEYIYKEITD